MKTMLRAAIVLATLLIPIAAQAAEGFSTANVNMRSGPSTRYPAVTVIPVGESVEIHGCLADIPWCDVSFYGGRGWVAGQYVRAVYQRQNVYIAPQYYRPLGIPTITFDLGNYWDRNYRSRNFYRDREIWRRGPDRDFNDRNDRRRPDRFRNDNDNTDRIIIERDRDRVRRDRDRDLRDRDTRDRDTGRRDRDTHVDPFPNRNDRTDRNDRNDRNDNNDNRRHRERNTVEGTDRNNRDNNPRFNDRNRSDDGQLRDRKRVLRCSPSDPQCGN